MDVIEAEAVVEVVVVTEVLMIVKVMVEKVEMVLMDYW